MGVELLTEPEVREAETASLEPYAEPISVYEAREEICSLQGLIDLRDDWIDDIPDSVVSSVDNVKYKCRAAWWGCLTLRLPAIFSRYTFDDDLSSSYNKVMHDYWEQKNSTGLVSSENIAAANEVLDRVIEGLEKERDRELARMTEMSHFSLV
jgi:hypothetical protein